MSCHNLYPKTNSNVKDFSVTLNNSPITLKNHVKYLGVFIDSKLNFHFHLNVVANKLSRALGILCKLKHVLPQSILLKLYYSLVHPLLLYGLVIWGSMFPTYLLNRQRACFREFNTLLCKTENIKTIRFI